MKSNWLYIISPCVICILILIIGVLKDSAQGGWHLLGMVAGMPIIAILAGIAVITKLLIRKNIALLWLVEAGAIVIVFLALAHLK